jgi:uncharacterized cysteine cluster protein YcgN (CxxCxxCC family)
MESAQHLNRKRLAAMNRAEWESLCDGCARCCLHKLQDEDTGTIFFTMVACQYLDLETCRCTQYANRSELVPTCIQLTPEKIERLKWLPRSCAYRRVFEGKQLNGWHPLISGNPQSIHRAGMSICGKAILESEVDMEKLEDYVIDWLE